MNARGRVAGAIFLIGAGGTSAACGLVVGASDYAAGGPGPDATLGAEGAAGNDSATDTHGGEFGDERADGTTRADAADARAPPEAAARDARDAGAEERAGGGADAGSADASGADSSDAAPIGCGQGLPVGQPGFDQIVRSCTLAVSCNPSTFAENIGACITKNVVNSSGTYACLGTIQDCSGFLQCSGERNTTPADCPSNALAARCDSANNLAIDCNSLSVKSCALFGGQCGLYTDGTLNTHADCLVAPGCTETDGLLHCTANGQRVYTCRGDAGFGLDCTLRNATCSTFDDAGPFCWIDGPPCSDAGYTCSGSVLHRCSGASHRETMTDCAAAGLSCSASDDGGSGTCLAPGCTSLATCPVESCGTDGMTLTVCVGGAPLLIDCTTLGFTSCATFTAQSTGTVYGYCR